jgi:hypothetical protein
MPLDDDATILSEAADGDRERRPPASHELVGGPVCGRLERISRIAGRSRVGAGLLLPAVDELVGEQPGRDGAILQVAPTMDEYVGATSECIHA